MLSLNVQIGCCPIDLHKPIMFIKGDPYISVGEEGELVSWKFMNKVAAPLYQCIPSISADAGKLMAIASLKVQLLSQLQISEKLVTLHEDNRIRIWESQDGICLSITNNLTFSFKPHLIAKNPIKCRFLIIIGENSLSILDCWTQKLVVTLQSLIQSFAKFVKGSLNQAHELQLMDNNGRMYKMNMSELFSQTFLDVGGYLSNTIKQSDQLEKVLANLKSLKLQNSYKKIQEEPLGEEAELIRKYVLDIKENGFLEIINPVMLQQHPETFSQLKQQCPVVSNIAFLKGKNLWYFVGMKSGNFYGIPCVTGSNQEWGILFDRCMGTAVNYIHITQNNILIVSWENGQFCVYNLDNHEYIIEKQLKDRKIEKESVNKFIEKQLKDRQIEKESVNKFISVEKSKYFDKKLSSSIKYPLKVYNVSSNNYFTNQLFGFQLYNNEVILFQSKARRLQNFRGIPIDQKIYSIVIGEDYTGVAYSSGIDMYTTQQFQRKILYSDWIWNDYDLEDKVKLPNDYHSYNLKNYSGTTLIEFSNRQYFQKIDYYEGKSQLMYETYGQIQEDQITNEKFAEFHLQKSQVLSTVHSKSDTSATCILKLKHNNVKKDYWKNTSFIIHGSVNRQLETMQGNLLDMMSKNYIFYSMFLWQEIKLPLLQQLINQVPKMFTFRKNYIHQGIAKSFTFYFKNSFRFESSSECATFQALATTTFFQLYSMQNIAYTDNMVEIVEYFTSMYQDITQNKRLNACTLSKISICSNPNIIKAGFNLLMSTVISQNISIHPIYDFFILNLKNCQQKKNKSGSLCFTETHWIVLLGIYFIYKDQIQEESALAKVVVQRIFDIIELSNFQKNPHLVTVVMKTLNQGIHKWKQYIPSQQITKFTADLFRLFFYCDGIGNVSNDDKKFNFCFQKWSSGELKKMKQTILRSVVYIAKQFNSEFMQLLRSQALNQKLHPAYPASVIQILRQYIKSEKPTNHLVFFIELLLQCLSPMTPQLRKYVQKNVLSTLQQMCSYKTISFNQPSQKLSLITQSHIYIYCLRTSTKWRTIAIKKNEKENQPDLSPNQTMALEMSPQGTYVALLTADRLQIWRLSSGFWSGVLGAFSKGWDFEAFGKGLKWQQDEQSITVISNNPSLNKNYKL